MAGRRGTGWADLLGCEVDMQRCSCRGEVCFQRCCRGVVAELCGGYLLGRELDLAEVRCVDVGCVS